MTVACCPLCGSGDVASNGDGVGTVKCSFCGWRGSAAELEPLPFDVEPTPSIPRGKPPGEERIRESARRAAKVKPGRDTVARLVLELT